MDFIHADPGSYMMRQCGGSWQYCNGICENCVNSRTTTTGKTGSWTESRGVTVIGPTSKTIPNGDLQGFPAYRLRREEKYDF